MNEQEKREKVIKGLMCCATNRLRREDCEAINCTYLGLEGNGCIHQLIRDSLALLKEQEPRVMSLEEALGGEECWVEYPNGGCGYADCYLSYTAKGTDIYRTMQHDFNVPIANYGKTWRCWTSRPTDEQRRETPWQ